MSQFTKEVKLELVKKFGSNEKDTGSPEVQIAFLTTRIKQLTQHFKDHVKDHGSRRGLLKMVSQRKQLLSYLKKTNHDKYNTIISELGIRG